MPPSLQLTSVTIGCPNPRELVQFYARLLGAEITAIEPPGVGEPDNAGWAQLRSASKQATYWSSRMAMPTSSPTPRRLNALTATRMR